MTSDLRNRLKPLDGKVVYVAGSTGLLGRHFVASALACGASVYDPLKTYVRFKADYVIHAAGYAAPSVFLREPIKTIEVNTTKTLALMGRVKKGGKFLYLSSSEVYSGCAAAVPCETDIGTTGPEHPRSCYIEGKRCGEAIVHAARQSGRVDAKIARVALAYGPGVKPNDQRVLSDFIRRGLHDGVIKLRDHGSAIRTYCYVADAVTMMWRALLEGNQVVYNIGGVETLSILELALMIGHELKAKVVKPFHDVPLVGSPDRVQLDISRYLAEFGPIEFLPLRKGIRRVIEWHRDNDAGEET